MIVGFGLLIGVLGPVVVLLLIFGDRGKPQASNLPEALRERGEWEQYTSLLYLFSPQDQRTFLQPLFEDSTLSLEEKQSKAVAYLDKIKESDYAEHGGGEFTTLGVADLDGKRGCKPRATA